MLNEPLLRAGTYLFVFLLAMMTGGMFPKPYSDALCLISVLMLLLIEWLGYSKERRLPIPLTLRKSSLATLRLLPLFFFLTLGVNLLSSRLFPASEAALSPITPSPALFIGAVLLAPLTEELLFRGILLRMLEKYGDVTAILISSLAFALAHGNFFQMPYALTAGILLALAARMGGSLLYPLLFHFLYNLCTFFSAHLSLPILLWISGGLALISLALFFIFPPAWRPVRGEKPAWRHAWIFLLYAAETVYVAALHLC